MSQYEPTYALDELRDALLRGAYAITASAFRGAAALYLDEDDIKACVTSLTPADFYKTMPSNTMPGLMQDVYKCRYCGYAVYLKVQIGNTGKMVVISFKQDEDP